ncbi:MAG: phosphoglycerate kinase [Spirochaetes bacterium]|nr:MAG: phosphoglycerate kinase [Spirochaetota bacterium]
MAIKYLKDLELKGRRALIRVDYNVPYDKEMNITDDTRITATLPTLNYCIEEGAKVILISHLGRPDGKVVPKMSLKPVALRLSQVLKKDVKFIDAPLGDAVRDTVASMKEGDVALLENIRYYPEEEKNDEAFGKLLASLGDVYINDAFATAHRGHASNESITHYVKDCAAGTLLQDEIEYFNKAMKNPEKPTLAIVGGVKVSTKIEVLKHIMDRVDYLVIGGAMAFTFLKAKGVNTGKSLVEENYVQTARDIMELAKKHNVQILLPVDAVIAPDMESGSKTSVVPIDNIPPDMAGFDVGPQSVALFRDVIMKSKTIIWNGPLGAFENAAFAGGTNMTAKAVAESGCLSVIGGGDSVSALNQSGYADKMSYISTGGGAFLEMLEGKTLPAIAALDR